jgi:hypothetical protein
MWQRPVAPSSLSSQRLSSALQNKQIGIYAMKTESNTQDDQNLNGHRQSGFACQNKELTC